jgi:hypothetical protein
MKESFVESSHLTPDRKSSNPSPALTLPLEASVPDLIHIFIFVKYRAGSIEPSMGEALSSILSTSKVKTNLYILQWFLSCSKVTKPSPWSDSR